MAEAASTLAMAIIWRSNLTLAQGAVPPAPLVAGSKRLAGRSGDFHGGALIEIHDLKGGASVEDFEICRPRVTGADKKLAQGRRGDDNLFLSLFGIGNQELNSVFDAADGLSSLRVGGRFGVRIEQIEQRCRIEYNHQCASSGPWRRRCSSA